jgi:hypothetical protein
MGITIGGSAITSEDCNALLSEPDDATVQRVMDDKSNSTWDIDKSVTYLSKLLETAPIQLQQKSKWWAIELSEATTTSSYGPLPKRPSSTKSNSKKHESPEAALAYFQKQLTIKVCALRIQSLTDSLTHSLTD